MADYKFWKWIETVGFVVEDVSRYLSYKDKDGTYYPWALMVDPSIEGVTKGSKEWGIQWAKSRAPKDLPDEKVYTYVETDNNCFKLRICETARNLPTWTCILEKEGIPPFAIKVNSDILAELILSSTLENGRCLQDVTLSRKNGRVGALHEGMPSYDKMCQMKKEREKITSFENENEEYER